MKYRMAPFETIFCKATNIYIQMLHSTGQQYNRLQFRLQFYKIFSNMLVHNDIRLYQALNKHIHRLPRALCNLLQSCNDEVGKTEKHKVAVYNLKY